MDRTTAAAILADAHNYGTSNPGMIITACVLIACHRDNWMGSVKVAMAAKREGDLETYAEYKAHAAESLAAKRGLEEFKMKAGAQWVFTGVIRVAPPAPTQRQLIRSRCENYRACGHFPA